MHTKVPRAVAQVTLLDLSAALLFAGAADAGLSGGDGGAEGGRGVGCQEGFELGQSLRKKVWCCVCES
ncbi:hypothetical protein TIFTF001_020645 [Ficus carica]|uniref:Secreted protein n=1 Tax=Ficus carica TaxID=3494 RepID=A0AA88DDU8_FICCA|nr:hypothetical protein TIFTF001_020645 [Ficus carica]